MSTKSQHQTAELAMPRAQEDDIRSEIEAWLTNYLTDLFNLKSEKILGSTTFQQLGLDSSAAVGLSGDLSNWLGCNINPAVAYDYPTIDELASALANSPAVQASFSRRGSAEGDQ